jgi:hypothetical protein
MMYKNLLFTFSLLFTILLVHSCKQKPQVAAYNETFQSIFVSDEGQFRGVNIGDDMETVKQVEKGTLIEEQPNYLLYQDTLGQQDLFDVAYYFDPSGLYTINFRGNFKQEQRANEVFTSFHDYYTRLHGNPSIRDGYYTWKTKSEKSEHIEISLINHRTQIDIHGTLEGQEGGFISLSIMNYDY